MSTRKTLFDEHSTRYLNELTTVLTDDQENVVRKVANKTAAMCRDEITVFALSTVVNVQPLWMYGSGKNTHYYIHPAAITTELKNFARFEAGDDDDGSGADVEDEGDEIESIHEKTERKFEFSYTAESASFVTLKELMVINGISKLDFGSEIDSIYMPIYDSGHCSMLILSIPRRNFLHLDSIHNDRHRKIVGDIKRMLVSSQLIYSQSYRANEIWTKVQSDMWECGWCSLLFAEWWRNSVASTAISDARTISLSHNKLKELAEKILAQQEIRKQLLTYDNRLSRAYNAVSLFEKT